MTDIASGRTHQSHAEVAVPVPTAAEPSSVFVHPSAIVESPNLGRGTRVWAFAHVLPGAHIGDDCNICDGVFVENDVTVGDRVTVKCGVQLWDGVTLEDDVFVGPNVTFTNDRFPRSRRPPRTFSRTVVRRGASIGANATILPDIVIGEGAMIGAGAVVTRDVPAHATVVGNPARQIAPAHSDERQPGGAGRSEDVSGGATTEGRDVGVAGVRLIALRDRSDGRGRLTVGEVQEQLPFVPQRYFVISDVPRGVVRGGHAHKRCEQFFICLHGACTLTVDDGRRNASLRLQSPVSGVHARPHVWATLSEFTEDALLLVLASDRYEAEDYVRDYSQFLLGGGP